MRKVLILLILALSIFLCYTIVVDGLEISETFAISKYEAVETASKQVDTLISQLVNVNDIEYKSKQDSLDTAIKNYKDAKEEYEEMESIIEQANNQDSGLVDIYDVDFLWTIIGNYGTEEGISLKFDVTRSLTSGLTSSEYTICDLKFTVSGDYIALTDFIYDIEEDSRLGFEISNFEMAKGGENLQATFTVKDVPINNKNLTQLQTSIDTNTSSSSTSNSTQNTLDPSNIINNNPVFKVNDLFNGGTDNTADTADTVY